MASARRRNGVASRLAFACDTGYVVDATITISPEIAAGDDGSNRGLLLVLFRYIDADEPQASAMVEGKEGCAPGDASVSLALTVP